MLSSINQRCYVSSRANTTRINLPDFVESKCFWLLLFSSESHTIVAVVCSRFFSPELPGRWCSWKSLQSEHLWDFTNSNHRIEGRDWKAVNSRPTLNFPFLPLCSWDTDDTNQHIIPRFILCPKLNLLNSILIISGTRGSPRHWEVLTHSHW